MEYFLYTLTFLILLSVAVFAIAEAKACKGNAEKKKDYLLILGCRVKGTEAEPTLQMRCKAAADYLKENPDTVAIACGGIVHSDQYKSEAQAIEEILISEGIEKIRIIREDKSTTTVENFNNAKKLIGEPDKYSIALLSSEFHLLRAAMIAKKAGFHCETVSAPSPKKELLKNYIREYFAFIIFIIGGR